MIIAGIGFRAGCPAGDIIDLVRRAQALTGRPAEGLASPAFKSGEPALHDAARALALPLIWVDRTVMAEVQRRCPTRSTAAQTAVGLASVAEACALAAVGPEGRLLLARIASPRATCAIAAGEPT